MDVGNPEVDRNDSPAKQVLGGAGARLRAVDSEGADRGPSVAPTPPAYLVRQSSLATFVINAP